MFRNGKKGRETFNASKANQYNKIVNEAVVRMWNLNGLIKNLVFLFIVF